MDVVREQIDRNELLASTRAVFVSSFTEGLESTIIMGAERLYDKADRCKTSQDQRRLLDARGVLQKNVVPLQAQLKKSMEKMLHRSFQTTYSNYRPSLPTSLLDGQVSLIDTSVFEDELRFNSITDNFRSEAGEQLRDLNIRIALLFEQDNIRERENPFRPYLFSRSIALAVESLGASPDLNNTITEQLAEDFSNQISPIYAAVNAHLAEHGIAAQLLLKPKRAPNPAPVAPRDDYDQPEQVTPASHNTTGQFGQQSRPAPAARPTQAQPPSYPQQYPQGQTQQSAPQVPQQWQQPQQAWQQAPQQQPQPAPQADEPQSPVERLFRSVKALASRPFRSTTDAGNAGAGAQADNYSMGAHLPQDAAPGGNAQGDGTWNGNAQQGHAAYGGVPGNGSAGAANISGGSGASHGAGGAFSGAQGAGAQPGTPGGRSSGGPSGTSYGQGSPNANGGSYSAGGQAGGTAQAGNFGAQPSGQGAHQSGSYGAGGGHAYGTNSGATSGGGFSGGTASIAQGGSSQSPSGGTHGGTSFEGGQGNSNAGTRFGSDGNQGHGGATSHGAANDAKNDANSGSAGGSGTGSHTGSNTGSGSSANGASNGTSSGNGSAAGASNGASGRQGAGSGGGSNGASAGGSTGGSNGGASANAGNGSNGASAGGQNNQQGNGSGANQSGTGDASSQDGAGAAEDNAGANAGEGGSNARPNWLSGKKAVGDVLRRFFAGNSAPDDFAEEADGLNSSEVASARPVRGLLAGSVQRLLRTETPKTEDMYSSNGDIRNLIMERRAKLSDEAHDAKEQMTIDIVSMLFEFILRDTQVPAEVRAQLGRLQFLVLKIALRDESLLTTKAHPARMLVNRIGSISLGLKQIDASGENIIAEICRIVEAILADETESPGLFLKMLDELDTFIARELLLKDKAVSGAVEVVEQAESRTLRLAHATAHVSEALAGLNINQHLQNFLENDWARAIEHAERTSPELANEYRLLVPDLLWSVLPKVSLEDRQQLLALLPPILKTIHGGMDPVGWPAGNKQTLMDWLFDAHTLVLRGGNTTTPPITFSAIHTHFKKFVESPETQPATPAVVTPINRKEYLEEAMRELDVRINLLDHFFDDDKDLPAEEEVESESAEGEAPAAEPIDIAERLRAGVAIEVNLGGKPSIGRLNWIDPNAANLVLTLQDQIEPSMISVRMFRRLLNNDRVRFLESEPIFERAVESLLVSASQV